MSMSQANAYGQNTKLSQQSSKLSHKSRKHHSSRRNAKSQRPSSKTDVWWRDQGRWWGQGQWRGQQSRTITHIIREEYHQLLTRWRFHLYRRCNVWHLNVKLSHQHFTNSLMQLKLNGFSLKFNGMAMICALQNPRRDNSLVCCLCGVREWRHFGAQSLIIELISVSTKTRTTA